MVLTAKNAKNTKKGRGGNLCDLCALCGLKNRVLASECVNRKERKAKGRRSLRYLLQSEPGDHRAMVAGPMARWFEGHHLRGPDIHVAPRQNPIDSSAFVS